MRGLALTLLAACSGAPAQQPLELRGTATKPAARSGPPPMLEIPPEQADYIASIDHTRLPAIARSGEVVVVVTNDEQMERGFPDITLEVRDRRDRVLRKVDVLDANDWERLVPDGVPTPALQQKLDAGNRELAKLHEEYDLVPLAAYDSFAGPTIIDDFEVLWERPELLLLRGEEPFRRIPSAQWPVPRYRNCLGGSCVDCEFMGTIPAVYKAPNIPILVVFVTYIGDGERCPTPPSAYHVVPL